MANRVLLGNLGSGNFGLKVSKKNVDGMCYWSRIFKW